MPRTRRTFTDEFKREVVKLVKEPGAIVTHIARDLGIEQSVLRRWVSHRLSVDSATRLESHIAPNHLQREFQALEPNQKWVADFTYIWTAEGWLYTAAVMDLYSRRIVGWSMSDTLQARVVSDVLLMALWRRGRPAALMHHSDQGSPVHQ